MLPCLLQIIFACLLAVAVARPSPDEDVVKILRDDRVEFEDGAYSFDIETEDGITRSEAGQSQGETGSVNKAGDVSWVLRRMESRK